MNKNFKVGVFALLSLIVVVPAHAYSSNPINHIFLRLDVDTMSEVTKSEFLQNEFSDFYVGKTGDLQNQWTAAYVQGENTYLELYDKNGSTTEADVGIAFGVDDKNHFLKYMPTLSAICTQPVVCEIQNRVSPESHSTWFSQFKVIDSNKKLDTWIMVYDTDYVKLKPTPEGSDWSAGDVSRKRYNSEWYKPQRFLKDIEELHLTVTSEHYNRLLKITDGQPILLTSALTSSGAVNTNGKPVDAVIYQNGQRYFFLTIGQATKVDRIVMTLNRKADDKVFTFGKSQLSLKNKTAIWTFF